MSRRRTPGKKQPPPAPRHRETGERSRPPAGPERDLALWLPHLFARALGRKPGRAPALAPDELYAAGRAVRGLSRGFTGGRGLAGTPYFAHPGSLAAYLLYFWPVSYMQARLLFRRLLPPAALSGADVLDAGSGPGAMAAAALDCGARRVTALDARREAVDLARDLACGRGFELETGRWDLEKEGELPAGKFKYVILGHVLNELWPSDPAAAEKRAARVEAMARRLPDGGRIVILEPALLGTTRELLRLRDALSGRGFTVHAPCLRQGPCPCLPDPTATCHADYPWQPPPYLTRLAHAARVGKESLRFSLSVLSPPGSERLDPGPDAFRVVSELMLSKNGRLRCFICNGRGRFTLSAKPAGDERWLQTFLSLRRYDAIRIGGTEERENGLGLTPASTLERISVWGE